MKSIWLMGIGCVMALTANGDTLEGLAGADLAAELRRQYSYRDDVVLPRPADEVWFDKGDAAVELAPMSWWGPAGPNDYYNVVAGSAEFAFRRDDYPPGELSAQTFAGSGWAVGIGEISGIATNMWMPDEDRRGDLARRLMYMAVMYPAKVWNVRGIMLMADGEWPLLSDYGRQLLLGWHRGDAVDEREVATCAEIAAAQGNVNPFVVYPELAEYLWGDHSGEGYISPDNRDRVPLKAVYSMATDEYVELYSPYVDEDSQWRVDGVRMDSDRVALEQLGVGIHELIFEGRRASGCIKIAVK